tara:strand:- start:23 stop:478 length:456 start_codon:yes stop_codon:yes gene_type:complete
MNIEESEMAPGTVGLLFDETPELNTAHVRPFVWAVLMYRGACRPSEVEAAIAQVCSVEELKTEVYDDGDEEMTRVEYLVGQVMAEFIAEGLCRYNDEKDLWVLTARDVTKLINVATAVDGQLPKHVLQEVANGSNAQRRHVETQAIGFKVG